MWGTAKEWSVAVRRSSVGEAIKVREIRSSTSLGDLILIFYAAADGFGSRETRVSTPCRLVRGKDFFRTRQFEDGQRSVEVGPLHFPSENWCDGGRGFLVLRFSNLQSLRAWCGARR